MIAGLRPRAVPCAWSSYLGGAAVAQRLAFDCPALAMRGWPLPRTLTKRLLLRLLALPLLLPLPLLLARL